MHLLDATALVKLAAEHEENAPGVLGPVGRYLAGKRNVFVSVVSAEEFLEGVKHEADGIEWLADGGFTWLPIGHSVARKCATLQRRLAESGARLGENDAWIAATAVAAGLELVGDDCAFERVPGLKYRRI